MFWDPDGLHWTESSDRRFAKASQRRASGVYDSEFDKLYAFILGLYGGTIRNTTLGTGDLLALIYRYNESKRRIRLNRLKGFVGLAPIQGIEDDIAYVDLVHGSLHDLFVNRGIFQTMGHEAGLSLHDSKEMLGKGDFFEAGLRSAEFVEVITLLASLPKAGLSTVKHLKVVRNQAEVTNFSKVLSSIPQQRRHTPETLPFSERADEILASTRERYPGSEHLQMMVDQPFRKVLSKLRSIAPNSWESSGELMYVGLDHNGLNRVKHVLRHAKDIPNRQGLHGVFDVDRREVITFLDKVWADINAQGITGDFSNGKRVYVIDMGERIGFEGGLGGAANGNVPLFKIKLIVVDGTTEVISAFPFR